ncbi:hypothetical protein RF11_02772 [Thelohanellus kitauei]|uniref:EGF-like domain-containing protein n=1 Tax=Thelohanellus kitauei TaxID=669202 RepID=A0A0C2MUJ8_THEKT|nr:hypothetical protein RF11_02772 [Thelohanellus kitauei]
MIIDFNQEVSPTFNELSDHSGLPIDKMRYNYIPIRHDYKNKQFSTYGVRRNDSSRTLSLKRNLPVRNTISVRSYFESCTIQCVSGTCNIFEGEEVCSCFPDYYGELCDKKCRSLIK